MRTLSSFGLFAISLAIFISSAWSTKNVHFANEIHLHKQTLLLELVQHIHQNNVLRNLWKDARKFHFEQNYDRFDNLDDVKYFARLHENGNLLETNGIFNIFNDKHRQQYIALYRLFRAAKTWETFYHISRWARFYVNKDMFINALTVAITHRSDCIGLSLPAPYEIMPQYFFNTHTIQRAKNEKMLDFDGIKKIQNLATVVIPTNYTNAFMDSHLDHKLAYFREDLGWNTMYFYWQAEYPFWMNEENLSKDRRGELYLFRMRQLLTRYNLERLSHELDDVADLNIYKPIAKGYNSLLSYANGVRFPEREDQHTCYVPENYADIEVIKDIESRFRNAIYLGEIKSEDDLGKFIASCKSDKYYGNIESVIRQLIEGTSANRFIVPSSLSHYETSLRDPAFYQILKRLMKIKWHYRDTLPAYTRENLEFSAIKIHSIDVEKLMTYFEDFDADISNVVDVDYDFHQKSDIQKFGRISRFGGHDFVIKSRQLRLGHLPFKLTINVNADRDVTGVVRLYLGPKYDANGLEYTKVEQQKYWHLLDQFRYDFVGGMNVLHRHSNNMLNYAKDRTTFYELFRTLMKVSKGHMPLKVNMTESYSGIPNRLMLPKGTKGGMPFQLFVIITEFFAPKNEQYHGYDPEISGGIGSGSRYIDGLPFDYPFDRKIYDTAWNVFNLKFKDVKIYHKD